MKTKPISRVLLTCAMLWTAAQPALATVVFSDNFDAETPVFNAALTQWTITNGSVDVIGSTFFDLLPGNGNYVDLDGTSRDAAVVTSSAFSLVPGVSYTLLFDLAGSQRGDNNTVRAGIDWDADSLFDVFLDITLDSSAPFAQFSIPFTVATPTSTGHIVFDHAGGDDFGLLLDRVVLNAFTPTTPPSATVPEPGTLALLGLGLSGLGLHRRRRA